MVFVFDNPSQSGAFVFDNPTETRSGAPGDFVEPGTLGTVDVQGLAGTLTITVDLQGQTGDTDVTGRHFGYEPDPGGFIDYIPPGIGAFDPDGDPLSYEIVTEPPNVTGKYDVNGYAEWQPDPGWSGTTQGTYRVWADGEPSTIEPFTLTFTRILEGVAGSVDVEGFAGSLAIGFEPTGTPGLVSVTGFAGTLGVSFEETGTLGFVTVEGFPGVLSGTFRGVRGETTVTGLSGTLIADQNLQGITGFVTVEGFPGAIQEPVSFEEPGVLGFVTVRGFVGVLNTEVPPVIHDQTLVESNWHVMNHLPAGVILDRDEYDELMAAWIELDYAIMTEEEILAVIGRGPYEHPVLRVEFGTGKYPPPKKIS